MLSREKDQNLGNVMLTENQPSQKKKLNVDEILSDMRNSPTINVFVEWVQKFFFKDKS